MSDALKLSGIAKGYNPGRPNEIAVLSGVDLAVARGEVCALVAPSGAGKSTLLHIAGLLDTPDAGSVTVAGDDLTGGSDRARTRARRDRIGFVYQFHHLLPEFTAEENIVLPQLAAGTAQGPARDRARDLMGRVGLGHRTGHRPAEMSGGEQQRVALARAAAPEPDLLLADEPTGNLDAATGETIVKLLFGLRERGATLVLVTHDPDLAARCDRTVRLTDGRIADAGLAQAAE